MRATTASSTSGHDVRPGPVDLGVVRRVEHDDVVASVPERRHVVGRVVDVEVGLDLGLATEEAEVPVGDAVAVEPGDGVGDRHLVAPVHDEAMGDDPDPHAGVGEAPQGRRRSPSNIGMSAEHAVLEDGQAVEAIEPTDVVELPLVEVPRSVRWGGRRSRSPFSSATTTAKAAV